MKRKKVVLLSVLLKILVLTVVVLTGCTGKETISVDTTLPNPAVLIPHLGDTGDQIFVNGEKLTDLNNGLDTVPGGNWLRVQWNTLTGANLDFVKIYRFGDYSALALVDSLPRSVANSNEYLDISVQNHNPTGQRWSYFMEVYNKNGFFSVSDTVSYKLIEKPFLLAPADNAQIGADTDLVFEWMATGDVLQYRIIVFTSEYEYVWHEDYYIVEDSDYSLHYTGPNLANFDDVFIWRVDAFGDLYTDDGISVSGSESQERIFRFVQ